MRLIVDGRRTFRIEKYRIAFLMLTSFMNNLNGTMENCLTSLICSSEVSFERVCFSGLSCTREPPID